MRPFSRPEKCGLATPSFLMRSAVMLDGIASVAFTCSKRESYPFQALDLISSRLARPAFLPVPLVTNSLGVEQRLRTHANVYTNGRPGSRRSEGTAQVHNHAGDFVDRGEPF